MVQPTALSTAHGAYAEGLNILRTPMSASTITRSTPDSPLRDPEHYQYD
jgi:hypothetical protein